MVHPPIVANFFVFGKKKNKKTKYGFTLNGLSIGSVYAWQTLFIVHVTNLLHNRAHFTDWHSGVDEPQCNAIANKCGWVDCNCNGETSMRNTVTSAHSSQCRYFAIASKECYALRLGITFQWTSVLQFS